ncbi:MAG: DUF3501 family protein [Hyphomonadaceae bacterium]
MPAAQRIITREDILPAAQYAAERKARRQAIVELKRLRRVPVGPFATFYFENFDTMLQQVMEMLHIEKGGEEQIADELAAYNPMIPQGGDLSATLMFEIPDERERDRLLRALGGVEAFLFLDIAGHRVAAEAERDIERTKADGKTSAVHFVHFRLPAAAGEALKQPGARVTLSIEHERYGHIAIVPEATRAALARDLD